MRITEITNARCTARAMRWMAIILLGVALMAPAVAAKPIQIPRQPDYHNGKIAFSYLSDIWVANEDGSNPRRLTVHTARDLLPRAPSMFGHTLGALDLYVSAAKEVAIIGDPAGDDTKRLVEEVWSRYLPNTVLAVASPGLAALGLALP